MKRYVAGVLHALDAENLTPLTVQAARVKLTGAELMASLFFKSALEARIAKLEQSGAGPTASEPVQ